MIRATLVSLFCNIALVVIKSAALVAVNSLAIAVDLGISFVGLTVSIILYYSVKLANKPADIFHNFGYGKVEHVCEALEAVVLIGIAIAMSFTAASHLLSPRHIDLPWIGFFSSLINVTINFGGAYYIFKMAKKSGSPAIRAEGIHYRMEGYISSIVGVSFVLFMLFRNSAALAPLAPYIDPATAILVSIILVVPSYKLARSSFFNLLDASVEEDSQMEILKPLTKHINEYCEFKNLRTRVSGRKKFIDFKVTVPEEIPFIRGHEIATLLEKEIMQAIPNCEVAVMMEPCKRDCEAIKDNKPCPYLY